MQFWDQVLKFLSKLFHVLNNSLTMALIIFIGSPISVYLFRDFAYSPEVAHQFTLTVILVLLPFLIYKALLYFLLALFDFILITATDYDRVYEVNMEKVRARVTKVLMERKVRYQALDTIALGLEKELLVKMRNFLHLKYPLIYVATDRPFVVVKIFRAIRSQKVASLMRQVENKERVGVRIFTEEQNEAKVLSKVIINSLEFLNKESGEEGEDDSMSDK